MTSAPTIECSHYQIIKAEKTEKSWIRRLHKKNIFHSDFHIIDKLPPIEIQSLTGVLIENRNISEAQATKSIDIYRK